MLRLALVATLLAKAGGSRNFSLAATLFMTSIISSSVGAATRMPRHRLRTGSMTLLGLWQQRIKRQLRVYLADAGAG